MTYMLKVNAKLNQKKCKVKQHNVNIESLRGWKLKHNGYDIGN